LTFLNGYAQTDYFALRRPSPHEKDVTGTGLTSRHHDED
jgi:hypothetical protein